MVEALVINDHKVGDTRRIAGTRCEVDESLVPWLNEAHLAYTVAQIEDLWLNTEGRVLTPPPLESHYPVPDVGTNRLPRVLQLTYYDPGSAAYRYHSALNASGVAVSAFARFGDSNPHSSLRQWDGEKQLHLVKLLLMTADVVMVHMDYRTLYHGLGELPGADTKLVRLYHGSVSPNMPRILVENDVDERHGAIQLGARLYHGRFSKTIRWLPIPMPIKDYECEAPAFDGTLRVSHSPTVRSYKGTEDLANCIKTLQAEGLQIELVLIENLKHGDAIKLKQTCHVTFDSFWLGIQGSGLEAACMGQMVIAGDDSVRDEYIRSEVGYCPYTYAGDKEQLMNVLRRALEQPSWRQAQARLTNEYVIRYHSYEAVGQRFQEALASPSLVEA